MFAVCYFTARCCFLLPFVPWLAYFYFKRIDYTIAFVYGVNSLLTLLFYAADKQNAEQGKWRIPEASLHCWELLCGWPGALIGQHLFHHKSRKLSFQLFFWLCVCINIVAAVLFAIYF